MNRWLALLCFVLALYPSFSSAQHAGESTPIRLGQLNGSLPGAWKRQVQTTNGYTVHLLQDDRGASVLVFDVVKTHLPLEQFLPGFIHAATQGHRITHRHPSVPELSEGLPQRNARQSIALQMLDGGHSYQTWVGYEVRGGRQVVAVVAADLALHHGTVSQLLETLYYLHLPSQTRARILVKNRAEVAKAARPAAAPPSSPPRAPQATAPGRQNLCSENGAGCYSGTQCCSGFCHASTCRTPGTTNSYKSPAQMMIDMNSDIGRRSSQW